MAWPSGLPRLGLAQLIVANAPLHYASNPKGVTTRAGNRLIVFGDTDGTNQAFHAQQWAYWTIRNEGAPVRQFTSSSWGGVNEVITSPYIWQQPAAAGNNIVMVGSQFTSPAINQVLPIVYRYALSADEGLTWGATAAMPALPDFDPTNVISPWHAIMSGDASHVYMAPYGLKQGDVVNNWSVGLYQSVDGFTFTRKSWIGLGGVAYGGLTFAGTETTLIRFSATHILAVIRGNTTGWTAYSTDDGATWSPPINFPNWFPNGQHGIAINDEWAFVVGRIGGDATGYNQASGWWLIDKWGNPCNPNAGSDNWGFTRWSGSVWQHAYRGNGIGYPLVIAEPNGLFVYDYSDLTAYQAVAQNGLIKSRLVLQGEPADALTALSTAIPPTLGDTAARTLGLVQQNRVLRDPVYDGSGNLVSANVLLYDSAAHATADDGATGLIGKYALVATYAAGTTNLLTETVTEVS